MKLSAVLKFAAAALATGALLVPSVGPAQAATYPPTVSVVYASPYLTGGYASVSVVGQDLPATGMKVKATYGSKSVTGSVYATAGKAGTALVKVSSVLPTTANRYTVKFTVSGTGLTGDLSTTQVYTVGKATSIKSFSVKKKSYGLYISGKTAKKTPVKITVKIGTKTYSKVVTSSSKGNFSYKFKKTTKKGAYTVTAKVDKNKKYFSSAVTKTYTRS